MESIEFYQSHLDRVSRSFAFCIRQLDQPLRTRVSLSYLMCRVLDTIEDSLWTDRAIRDRVYAEFESFLRALPTEAIVRTWSEKFPSSMPEGEKLLLKDAFPLFRDLHELPPSTRASLQQTVFRMYQGMRHYSDTQDATGSLRLKNLVEVNRYCYFVAGVVGELLSRLVLEHRPDFRPAPEFMKNAFHFGLFLQKVNLLKDQRGDEKEGRFLIPDRDLVFSSLRENAIGSIEYIAALPAEEKGYRIFCAWSLFLGAASLPFIQQAYKQNDNSKIPRTVTEELLQVVADIAQDNEALRNALDEYLPMIPELKHPEEDASSAEWFDRISGKVLKPAELAELRIV